jgi:hypothetical protein
LAAVAAHVTSASASALPAHNSITGRCTECRSEQVCQEGGSESVGVQCARLVHATHEPTTPRA